MYKPTLLGLMVIQKLGNTDTKMKKVWYKTRAVEKISTNKM